MPGIGTITAAVATWNGSRVIGETLTAILNQTRAPDEVIVVDDGSPEDMTVVLAPFMDRIRLIRIDNRGPEGAKKVAIEAAMGDWVALCDHDDLWRPDHLARLEGLVAAYPATDFAFSNFAEFGTASHFSDKFASMGPTFWTRTASEPDADGYQLIGTDGFRLLLAGNPFFPSAGLFRKALYARVGGIREGFSFNVSADIDMTRRFALEGIMACDHRITVDIRKDGQNYSGANLRAAMDRLLMLRAHIAEGGIYAPYRSDLEQAARAAAIEAMVNALEKRDIATLKTVRAGMRWRDLPMALRLRVMLALLPFGAGRAMLWLYDRIAGGGRR